MAQSKRPSKKGSRKPKSPIAELDFPLNKRDMIFLGIGLGLIILGYALMATGISNEPAVTDGTWNNPLAVVIAPILLIAGYCVVIPMAILKFFSKTKESGENEPNVQSN